MEGATAWQNTAADCEMIISLSLKKKNTKQKHTTAIKNQTKLPPKNPKAYEALFQQFEGATLK